LFSKGLVSTKMILLQKRESSYERLPCIQCDCTPFFLWSRMKNGLQNICEADVNARIELLYYWTDKAFICVNVLGFYLH
jgi:hypothetical protein